MLTPLDSDQRWVANKRGAKHVNLYGTITLDMGHHVDLQPIMPAAVAP